MNLGTLINAATNATNVITIIAIVIFVFGRENSPIHKEPIRAICGKIALSTLMCGSLWNLLTFSTPAPSEIVTNLGISMVFLMGAHWHYCEFLKDAKPPKVQRPKTKVKRTPRVLKAVKA